uniref:Uncharacterized protein n=1 Tax=Rhodnius prolixus TaxID=13249 RepID=T1HDP8_RHOPR
MASSASINYVYCPAALSSRLLHKNSRLFSTEPISEQSEHKETIVYIGPLTRQIRRVKLFTLMTSMSGIFAQPVIMERALELGSSTSTIILVCSFVGKY